MKFPITKKQFIKFLRSKNPRSIGGDPNDSEYCPLCRAAQQVGGLSIEIPKVGCWRPKNARDEWNMSVPKWAVGFQNKALSLARDLGKSGYRRLSYGKLASIMKSIH